MDKNEAIKIIRSNYPTGRHQLCKALETLIPELKKSDDEKIRKTLKSFFDSEISDYGNVEWRNGIRYGEIVSWLKKQGEIKRSDYPYVPGWRENRPDNKPKIKQSILMLTTHGVAEGEWLGEEWCQYRWSCKIKDTEVLYWLHLSDLETLEKENVKQDFSWLEKQGNISPTKDELEALRIAAYEPAKNWSEKLQSLYEKLTYYEYDEQKPTDKIEPKFKIGDWIVSNRTNKTYKIDSIDTKDANYIIYSCVPSVYTNEDSPCFSESMIHLWTIQDAKDGDVLAFYSEYKGNRMVQVGIIKKYVGKHGGCSNTFNIYVGVNWDNNLQIDEYMGCSDIRPATKEQRDLLFVKLKEAGYEWDVEKKELKKIEQKSAWSEEDENLYNRCMSAIQTRYNDGLFTTNEYKQTSLWLKSLKGRMKGEAK